MIGVSFLSEDQLIAYGWVGFPSRNRAMQEGLGVSITSITRENDIGMICPSCSTNNPDDSAACVNCGYKFRFGHAYNDPKGMQFLDLRKSSMKKSRAMALAFASIGLLVLILVIFHWLKTV